MLTCSSSSLLSVPSSPIPQLHCYHHRPTVFSLLRFDIKLHVMKLPWWLSQYSICLQCRKPGFNPWVRKISWRRKWQSTPIFLPGISCGRRSLVDYSPRGRKESDTTERLHLHRHVKVLIRSNFPQGQWSDFTSFSIWHHALLGGFDH